jgi:hypothetical protein
MSGEALLGSGVRLNGGTKVRKHCRGETAFLREGGCLVGKLGKADASKEAVVQNGGGGSPERRVAGVAGDDIAQRDERSSEFRSA